MALEHEITQFGQRMGIADLSLTRDGLLALDIDGMGRVHLERGADELLVYLARPAPPHDSGMPGRILAVCHYAKEHPIPLSGGMHKGQAVLLTRLAERSATAAALENTLEYLARRMNEIFRK